MVNSEVYTGASTNLSCSSTCRTCHWHESQYNRTSTEFVSELQKLQLTYVRIVWKNKKSSFHLEFLSNRKRPEKCLLEFYGNYTLVSFLLKKGMSVILLSTMHHIASIVPETRKSEIIGFDSSTKRGVDALDQKILSRIRRLSMVLFHAVLNIFRVNSRVLCQVSNSARKGTLLTTCEATNL